MIFYISIKESVDRYASFIRWWTFIIGECYQSFNLEMYIPKGNKDKALIRKMKGL